MSDEFTIAAKMKLDDAIAEHGRYEDALAEIVTMIDRLRTDDEMGPCIDGIQRVAIEALGIRNDKPAPLHGGEREPEKDEWPEGSGPYGF